MQKASNTANLVQMVKLPIKLKVVKQQIQERLSLTELCLEQQQL